MYPRGYNRKCPHLDVKAHKVHMVGLKAVTPMKISLTNMAKNTKMRLTQMTLTR